MMSPETYERIKPYIPVAKHYVDNQVYVGCDLQAFKEVYIELDPQPIDLSCSGCVTNALERLYDFIKEYENAH